MPFLSLLWGVTGITALGKYLLMALAGLLVFGWVVHGITAPYKRQIKALESYNKELLAAAEQREAILTAHELRVEEDRVNQENFDVRIKAWLSGSPAVCRASADELRKLTAAAAR